MGFSVVPDKSSGDIFTEAMWDTYIKDNFNTGVPVLLANSTLSGSSATISFSGISQNWAHLRMVMYLRGDTAAASTNVNLQFNGDTGSNYDNQYIRGSAAATSAVEAFAQTAALVGSMPCASAGANLFSAVTADIPFYSQSTNNKTMSSQWARKTGTSSGSLELISVASFWRSSSAITQIVLFGSAGNFDTGSRVTLYGMP
jgi:hypothetical protein